MSPQESHSAIAIGGCCTWLYVARPWLVLSGPFLTCFTQTNIKVSSHLCRGLISGTLCRPNLDCHSLHAD